MIRYRGPRLIRAGFIGVVLIVLVIAVGLHPAQLADLASSIRYRALFSEAGGLAAGNDVKISGVKVGTVSRVSLDRGKAMVTFTVKSIVELGSETTAHIRTGTLLGQRILTLESAGDTRLRPFDVIPVSRTSSPYSLSEAVSNLTSNVAETDTGAVNQSLDTLAATINQIAPQLGPTFDGLTRLSQSINERNQSVGELLKNAADVTGILSQRSQQVNALILDANDLVAVLVQRRQAIADLLADTSALAKQISGLIADNEAQLGPTLDKLNATMAMLEKNRDNIGKALPGLAKFETGLSEIVANGPYYNAFIPNLIPPEFLQPFIDYIAGFRRGVDNGQPPDNAGPRAELPFPYNGIPLPQEQWPR